MPSPRTLLLVAGLVALAVGLGLGLRPLLSGDHDEHGRIAIPPGSGTVDLPQGEVSVYYEDGRPVAIEDAIEKPEVELSIRPAGGGEELELDGDGGHETGISETRAWADFETLDVPEAGPYSVEVIDATTPGAMPAITFGTSGASPTALLLLIGGVAAGAILITMALLTGREREPDAG